MNLPQVVEICDEESGSTASILVSLGFNCFRWRPMLDGSPRDMLWAEEGFASGNKRPTASGIPLLFPFPGRIGGAKFMFQGCEYRLEPGDAFGNAIHGFVYNRPWRVVEQTAARLTGEFQASLDDASLLEHWPADFRIRVSYEVRGRELLSKICYECVGDKPLPCGFGTHPYFRLPLTEGGSAPETIVTVPAQHTWEANDMLPTGRKLPLDDEQLSTTGLQLGNRTFDTYFTDLQVDRDQQVRTHLRDPRGRVLTQSFDRSFTQCIVYTPPHREAICIEPYTCLPDTFRLSAEGYSTGHQLFQPGESFRTTIRIEVAE